MAYRRKAARKSYTRKPARKSYSKRRAAPKRRTAKRRTAKRSSGQRITLVIQQAPATTSNLVQPATKAPASRARFGG